VRVEPIGRFGPIETNLVSTHLPKPNPGPARRWGGKRGRDSGDEPLCNPNQQTRKGETGGRYGGDVDEQNQQQKLSAQATIAVRRQPGEKPCAHRNAKQANHRRLNPKTPNAQHAREQLCLHGSGRDTQPTSNASRCTNRYSTPNKPTHGDDTGLLGHWKQRQVDTAPRTDECIPSIQTTTRPRLLGRLDIDNPTGSNAH